MLWIMNHWWLWLIGLFIGIIAGIVSFILFAATQNGHGKGNDALCVGSFFGMIIFIVTAALSKILLIMSLVIWAVKYFKG